MSRFSPRASLVLWQARERYRKARHAFWERRGDETRVAHWSRLLREARVMVARRRGQLAVTGVSPRGLLMIGRFEGFRSHPYRDPVGVWTIGYGETRGIGPRTPPWTEKYARERLGVRVNRDYLAPVLAAAKGANVVLKQHEADALASLTYNLGPGILAPDRTMGSALRSRDRARIADAFLVYDKAGGKALPGLTRRRQLERTLFRTGRYPS